MKPTPVIGEALLHPISLLCIALWAINDHLLKARFGSWLTGKLSDVTGLVAFALLLLTLLEIVLWATDNPRRVRQREWLVILFAVGACFGAAKLTASGDLAYSLWVGLLRDPMATFSEPLVVAQRVQHTQDPTDAIALPMLAVAWWIGKRYTVNAACSDKEPAESPSTEAPDAGGAKADDEPTDDGQPTATDEADTDTTGASV